MEVRPYKTILENLKANGESEIDRLISLGEQESFYIDFKEVTTNLFDNKLSDSDRKNYAKAISGFSNTSGGLLIWGIKEQDDKFTKNKIDNPNNFVKILNNEVSLLTLPSQKEVNSFAIKDSNNKGFVITEIPKYYFSPVQIITGIKDIQYRYYIRSGSSFVPANHDLLTGLYNRQRSSKTIFCWNVDKNSYHEDEKEIKCRIGFTIQNKGLGVLRNVWINFSAGNINLELEKTQQISVFEGWNMWSLGLNLVTNDAYKFAPQHFLNPFIIVFKIDKNNLPDNGFIYISFGSDQSAPLELEIKFDKKKFEEFMEIEKRDANSFISHFGLNNNALRNF
jgi:hypothetical protein